MGDIESQLTKLGSDLNVKLEVILNKQEENKSLIQQSTTIVQNIEKTSQEAPKSGVYDAEVLLEKMKGSIFSQMKGPQGQDSDEAYELHSRIAQNIFDRKLDPAWVSQKGKYTISGKYSFAVLASQDYVFVDGNGNNVEMLKKDDLSLVGTLKTDGNAVFSFLLQGLKLFVGCANNNLFIFEIDTMKRIKDIKSTSIIYCFH